MSAWAKLTINEQIQAGAVDRLGIGDIARLITNGNADKEIDLIREMSEDYMAMRLRAHGDFVHSLARVLRSGWIDGEEYKAGALAFVTQTQYTANQNFLHIEHSQCFPEYMVTREDFRNYLTLKPPLPKDCILAKWVDDNQQTGNTICQPILNKTLLPLERETTESLLLIYHYLEEKDIKPGDIVTISAKTAWGEIHAGKFQTDLIKGRPGSRTTAQIIMNGGEELDYKTFAKKYNSRLKAPDKTQ